MRTDHSHPFGIVRREFLQVGFSGFLGLGTAGLLAGQRRARADQARPENRPGTRARAKSMILVFMSGGLGHLDSFDMKPEAPEGIRGEFRPIETATPGMMLCEHLPGMAARSNQLSVVRSLSHKYNNHLNATHELLTGHSQPGAFFDKIASRDDYPCYASAMSYARPRSDGVPSGVMLPTYLMEGPLTWPGQHAGFLGPRHDPWQIKGDPNSPDFQVESLTLPDGFSVERLESRRDLLGSLARQKEQFGSLSESSKDPFDEQREQAYNLLLSGSVSQAFQIQHEDPRIRDRYGRHMFGQSLLLARRLVQAGVPIVQANMGRVQYWDLHSNNFKRLKKDLLPPLDQGFSALLDDLQSLGMLDDTLVVLTGEFGRTPRIGAGGNGTGRDGRDHWSRCFSAVLAGAGVQGGQIIGASDRIGAYPATRAYSPADLAATIYSALGIDLGTELIDKFNRPLQLCQGEPIPVFSGTSA
ncbi:MAG TPA: DUF1501 domain-containing protein [Isosphaeraceae bacterium]|nr:DUF1501 domain-containing protein [Isosphaeraceae bacterium]